MGPTHYRWDPDVRRIVREIEAKFTNVRCNTYQDHPWVGWDGRSIDVWGGIGRGDPLRLHTGYQIWDFLMDMPGAPFIRHMIFVNQLWTSFGGRSRWSDSDHRGLLRHLHVTYWKP